MAVDTPRKAIYSLAYLAPPDYDGQQRTRWTYADRAIAVFDAGGDAYNVFFDAITRWPSVMVGISVTTLTQYNAILTRETNELALSGLSPDLLAPRVEPYNVQRLITIALGFGLSI